MAVTDRIAIAVDGRDTTGIAYTAELRVRRGATLVLAHGAGAGQTHRFMVGFARGLAARGVDVFTFNFLYTEHKRKVPDRPEVLETCYRQAIEAAHSHGPFAGNKVFIGGKSMGGRIASQLAAAGDATSPRISGLVLLGYPLHPPGKPGQLRVAHLPNIHVPTLVVQGERDPFGSPEELRPHFSRLVPPVTLIAVEGGDHSLAPRTGHRRSADQVYAQVQDAISAWVAAL